MSLTFKFKNFIKKMIEETKNLHSSPPFMARNHSENKTGKAHMLNNYKKLNEQLQFTGYFISQKDVYV